MSDADRDAEQEERGPGRPRDEAIDRAVLAAAVEQLATRGFESMSLVAIAKAAGTTRQAIYRRWPTRADLATDAIASMRGSDDDVIETDDPFADLVAELAGFRRGVTRPGGVSMVGSMLLDGGDAAQRDLFRERIVAPRRRRIRRILERAESAGHVDLSLDAAMAVDAAIGTFYAACVAGLVPDDDWPDRSARHVWRSLGGSPPS